MTKYFIHDSQEMLCFWHSVVTVEIDNNERDNSRENKHFNDLVEKYKHFNDQVISAHLVTAVSAMFGGKECSN